MDGVVRVGVWGSFFEGKRVPVKVGLVLGAGGVLGGAWLVGGLSALARETDWDPGTADYIVGTSAGSMIGALVAAGVPPWFMVAHSRGEVFEGLVGPGRPPRRRRGPLGRRQLPPPPRPARDRPRLAPHGLHGAVEPAAAHAAPDGRRLGAVRVRLDRPAQGGRDPRGAGRLGRPPELLGRGVRLRVPAAAPRSAGSARRAPHIGDAVAASCAIPGFYRPVKIGSRRYVDGGVCSVSNLDLVAGRGLDLVICLNPLTSSPRASGGRLAPAARSTSSPRSRAARRAAGCSARGAQGAPLRHRGRDHRADRRGPRRDGPELDERRAPPGRDRHRRGDRRRAARAAPSCASSSSGLPQASRTRSAARPDRRRAGPRCGRREQARGVRAAP